MKGPQPMGYELDPELVPVMAALAERAAAATARGAAVLYAHGGGMIMGSLDLYDKVIGWYVGQTGVPFVSVGYRLAPEVTGTALAEDVFAGLRWLISHAEELGADPARIAVMGDSGGGGLAAATAILARDRGGRPGPPDPGLSDAR